MNIYVLLLEGDRIYVGKTLNLDRRMTEHFEGYGSAWTTKYKPIKLLYTTPGDNEDYHVIRMMGQYGVDNVRGGSFSRIIMTDEDIRMAERLLQTASDKCYNCGQSGHYIKDCPSGFTTKSALKSASTFVSAEVSTSTGPPTFASASTATSASKARTSKPSTTKARKSTTKASNCQRCGRNSHTTECCYAKTNLEGFTIVDDDDDNYCERCGRDNHIEENCRAIFDINGYYIEDVSSDDSEYYSSEGDTVVYNNTLNVECCIQ